MKQRQKSEIAKMAKILPKSAQLKNNPRKFSMHVFSLHFSSDYPSYISRPASTVRPLALLVSTAAPSRGGCLPRGTTRVVDSDKVPPKLK